MNNKLWGQKRKGPWPNVSYNPSISGQEKPQNTSDCEHDSQM